MRRTHMFNVPVYATTAILLLLAVSEIVSIVTKAYVPSLLVAIGGSGRDRAGVSDHHPAIRLPGGGGGSWPIDRGSARLHHHPTKATGPRTQQPDRGLSEARLGGRRPERGRG